MNRSAAIRAPSAVAIALAAAGLALLALFRTGLNTLETKGDVVLFIMVALAQAALYVAACWLALRARPGRSSLMIVIVFAALFRLSLLFTPPYLSSDMYRYIWDGRVQAAGINPYRFIPADEALAHLRDKEIYPHINRREYAPTIYPPAAQMIFAAVTRVSESVTWMKAAMSGFEVITLWGLIQLLISFKLPRHYVIFYAWHPLLVWETAGSGHLDSALIAFVTLALLATRLNRPALTGFALAAAALVKFFPVLLFPALYRRWDWKMPLAFGATIGVGYLPYLSVGRGVFGFLSGYAAEEGMDSGERFFPLLLVRKALGEAAVPLTMYVGLALAVLLGIAAWSVFKRESTEQGFVTGALALAVAFTLLLSPRYAWYYAWLVPFLCFRPALPLLYITSVSLVLYGFWLGEPSEHFVLLNSVLYAPFALLCVLSLWRRFSRPDNARVLAAEVVKQA